MTTTKSNDNLFNISPVDGRYRDYTSELTPYFSEFGLMRRRTKIEVEYLIKLTTTEHLQLNPPKKKLRDIYQNFTVEEARLIKQIETDGYKDIPATNHDVKAVEYFVKNQLTNLGLDKLKPYVHFGLTSEDINNLAYATMVKSATEKPIINIIKAIIKSLAELTTEHKDLPMLAHTHGQPATPTTLGKEMGVFLSRLTTQTDKLLNSLAGLQGKLGGATGALNAHYSAFPDVDWLDFATQFVNKLGLEPNKLVTQIESRDSLAELLLTIVRINNILIDVATDCWIYVSKGYFRQRNAGGEVGSSTMPHKLNPIDFENAEGNLNKANSDLEFIADYVTKSRLQRDLSDSTVMRNLGVGYAHVLLGYKKINAGLSKINPDYSEIRTDLNHHPQVITEAWQTFLRKRGYSDAYELVKDSLASTEMTETGLNQAIQNLPVSEEEKQILTELNPVDYTGKAPELASDAVETADSLLQKLRSLSDDQGSTGET